jgi:hypothetical protein
VRALCRQHGHGLDEREGAYLVRHGEEPSAVEEEERHAEGPGELLHGRASRKVEQLRVAKVVDRHQRRTALERDLDESLSLLQVHFLLTHERARASERSGQRECAWTYACERERERRKRERELEMEVDLVLAR